MPEINDNPAAVTPEVNPETIAAAIGQQQQVAPVAEPTPPDNNDGTQQDEGFLNRLVEATNGKINNLEQLSHLIGRADQLDDVQARYKQLKAQSELSPFANDTVKSINDFFANGGTPEEYYNLIDLQRVDLSTMGDLDAIRKQYSIQYPSMSQAEIDALIKGDIGNFDGEPKEEGGTPVVDPAVSARLKRQAQEAKAWIADKQKSVATPAAALSKQVNIQKQQQLESAWSSVTEFALQGINEIDVAVEGFEGEDGFKFPIPKEFLGPLAEAVKAFAIEANQRGQLALSQNGFDAEIKPALQQWARSVVMMNYGDQIMEAHAKHIAAVTERKIRSEYSGPPPNPPGSQNGGGAKSNEAFDKIRANLKKQFGV